MTLSHEAQEAYWFSDAEGRLAHLDDGPDQSYFKGQSDILEWVEYFAEKLQPSLIVRLLLKENARRNVAEAIRVACDRDLLRVVLEHLRGWYDDADIEAAFNTIKEEKPG